MKIMSNFRSWFIGDTVVSDGRLHVFTPLDPIFLILPAFVNVSYRFVNTHTLTHTSDAP